MREAPRLHDVAGHAGFLGRGGARLREQRLSAAAAWRLLKTPSSEAGIQAYYRALLGRAPEADALLQSMRALQLGHATRIDVIGSIATSPEARAKGVRGEGLLLIRLVRLGFTLSGFRRRVLRRRMSLALQAEPVGAVSAPAATHSDGSGVEFMRRLTTLEGRLAELLRAQASAEDLEGLKERVATLESTLMEVLNAEAERLRNPPGA